MPWRDGGPTRRAILVSSTLAGFVLVTLGIAGCSDDDDAGPDVEDDEPATETTSDIVVEPTLALELNTSADPDFIPDVLADDVVTADELEEAYQRWIGCLADGGAAGIYAYDIELHVGMAADYSLASAVAGVNDTASLEASCSRDFIGDLIERFYDANPAEPDLAERQRDSVVACLAAVNPAFADAVPAVLTLDTTGTGAFVGDLQLDPAAIDAEPGEVEPVRRCIGSLGAPWTEFG